MEVQGDAGDPWLVGWVGTPWAEPPPRSRNHLRWVEAGPAQHPPGPTDQVPPASGLSWPWYSPVSHGL